MKNARGLWLIAITASAVLYCARANACPECNIHNNLADSVRSSTNVFLGKVIGRIDDRTAEVEVLKVLRWPGVVADRKLEKEPCFLECERS